MNIVKRIKEKAIISLLAVTVVLSGLPIMANAAQDNAAQKVSNQKQQSVTGKVLTTEEKEAAAKKLSVAEINWYLSQMNSGDIAATLRLFRVSQILKDKSIENVSTDSLMTGAIKGAVGSLGDPHSVYMDPKMYKGFMLQTKGSFGGVGLELSLKDKVLTVLAPIDGMPGAKAGILSGDQIIKIGSQDTKDISLDEAVNLIRGPEGSEVNLTISRPGQEVKEYPLVRTTIQIKTVSGKMLQNGMGYIRLSMFNENTGEDLDKKLAEMEQQGMKGLVLDLRNNPGGLLAESVKVASHFVPKGPVVSVVTNDGTRKTSYSPLASVKYPLVVLVNGGSASASEIVAGAVQDTKAGTLVGTKTYGKGSVQTIFPLNDASAVKLTIAKYYTPNNRSIHGVGIEPDIKVEIPDGKPNGKDLQLEKAIEVLKGKL